MPYILPHHPVPTSAEATPIPLPQHKTTKGRRSIFSLMHDSDASARSTAYSRSSLDGESSEDAASPPPSPRLTPRGHAPVTLSSLVPFPSMGGSLPSSTTPARPPAGTPNQSPTQPPGRPLKPSLKQSQPVPLLSTPTPLSRVQSAPASSRATPQPVKSVHFPERGEDLRCLRLFRPAGRPLAVSTGAIDETETETEGTDSSALHARLFGFASAATRHPSVTDAPVALDTQQTSPVPAPAARSAASAGAAHVLLEALQLPPARPRALCGSVLVRNVAFAKTVAVRFTLDGWQTTSEVRARYASAVPVLPAPFSEPRAHAGGWDRWVFSIRLEDMGGSLAEKTLWLAVRFIAHGPSGGEWWDNNGGANYRVAFRHEPAAARVPRVLGLSFGAPPQPRPQLLPLQLPTPKLSPRNYAPPAQLPSPPDSARTSPTLDTRGALETGGDDHPAADATRAALVRQWCFHQPGADRAVDPPNGLGLWGTAREGLVGTRHAPSFVGAGI